MTSLPRAGELRAAIARAGFARLPRAFPAAEAAAMCDRIWSALEATHGMRRDDRATWTIAQPRHLQALPRAGAFDAVASPAVLAAIDEMLGPGSWRRPKRWGQALVTFPGSQADWRVPDAVWHIDWPARDAEAPLFGIKVLAYASSVRAGGGGTVVVAGSHRLVAEHVAASPARDAGGSAEVRTALVRAHPWFRELCVPPRERARDPAQAAARAAERADRLMARATAIGGTDVQVVELVGEPGDVVLFHPWLLHAPAANAGEEPRMMVSENLNTAAGLALYAPPTARPTR